MKYNVFNSLFYNVVTDVRPYIKAVFINVSKQGMPYEFLNWCSNIFVFEKIKKSVSSAVLWLFVFLSSIVLKIFDISPLRELLRRIMDENVDSEREMESDSDSGTLEQSALAAAAGDAGPDAPDQDEDEDEEQFDITLPDTHSYMGPGLEPLSGRRVLEAGWAGAVAGAAHHGAVFPGETVPMLLPPGPLRATILADRLFCLLAPDESGTRLSGLGVLCEVQAGAAGAGVIARAAHRVRLRRARAAPLHDYSSMQMVEVVVLPELGARATPPARLAALDGRRRHDDGEPARRLRRLEAAVSAWPAWLWRLQDLRPLRARLADHFRSLQLEHKMPEEPVSLSFWVASNLALAPRDRLALFAADDAVLRLRLALRCIDRSTTLCCRACGAEIARRDQLLAMSSAGVHSNFTNLGGFMHDVATTRAARNVSLGAASAEYSWFPGYCWRTAVCADCHAHVGWRFDALKRSLRPAQFFALTRNTVAPRAAALPEPL